MSEKMNQEQIEELFSLSCEDRYDYFLTRMVDGGEIWILVNDAEEFLKLDAKEHGLDYLPIWPSEELALEYSYDIEEVLQPKSIPLETFFERWITGLTRDKFQINVFPTFEGEVWIMEPADFKEELEEGLASL